MILTGKEVCTVSGARCQIPFSYGGVTFNECTASDNNGVDWCYTDQSTRAWENCGPCNGKNCSIEQEKGAIL